MPISQVSGLIKSVFGLSSAVLSVLYTGIFEAENVGRFLLLLSVGVPLLGMVSSVPLNLVPAKHLSYAIERAQGVRSVWRTAFFGPHFLDRSVVLFTIAPDLTSSSLCCCFRSKYLRYSLPIRFLIQCSVICVRRSVSEIYITNIDVSYVEYALNAIRNICQQ